MSTTTETGPVLRVNDVVLALKGSAAPIVEGVQLAVRPGELLALVGESGAGKTTLALEVLGYRRDGVERERGSVVVDGVEITALGPTELRAARGRRVSYVPQNPTSALNPSHRVGDQIAEAREVHGLDASGDVVPALFRRVALPDDRDFRRRFPHQLSGGQQQRVAIAMALACDPDVVVLDEPTTALDVVTQKHVLDLIVSLRDDRAAAFLYVTHDLAVVAEVATRIAVMYAGRIVECAARDEVLYAPRHPYTRALVAAVPRMDVTTKLTGIPGVAPSLHDRPAGCSFAPRCPCAEDRCTVAPPPLETVAAGHEVRCLRWADLPPRVADAPRVPRSPPTGDPVLRVETLEAGYRDVRILGGVSLEVWPGECLAVVGESGSGKTTLARCLLGLHAPSAGRIVLGDQPLPRRAARRTDEQRRRVQIVFQNPDASLNPRTTVGDAVARPCRQLQGMDKVAARAEAERLLELVRLSPRLATRYPSQLSGGERQRVSIARALAAGPELLVCDEVTSALDVSVQAAVVELLEDLRREIGLAIVFITHDLALVSAIADRVIVLERGAVREAGTTAQVLGAPQDDYTRTLLGAAPRLGPRAVAVADEA